ncbi:hypothetical protein [Mycolicibacterium sp. P9-22]|uniref:hypothetical protein n=1 Tax=Mycolicibacterium sp. P9-22 TaxID=2024613 RepID=UPI0011ED18CD|nr:hypothetical protein [Mycolicibacterium sp. P9-22]
MAHGRPVISRFTLPCLLVAVATLSGCGIQIQTLAQSPVAPAAADTRFAPAESALHIFTPCIAGTAEPLMGAASAISEFLLGKDQFRTECAHNSAVIMGSDKVIDQAPRMTALQPVVAPAPVNPPAPGVLVTDDLVSAVLTGTSEYWYQPVIGPA